MISGYPGERTSSLISTSSTSYLAAPPSKTIINTGIASLQIARDKRKSLELTPQSIADGIYDLGVMFYYRG